MPQGPQPNESPIPWLCHRKKMKLVQAWIEIHKDDLMADWELASTGRAVFTIEPLK